MSFFPSRKVFLQIGSLSIRWYAVLIMIGACISYLLIKKDMKKSKYMDKNDYLDDLFILIMWVGIIGCRLWFCLFFDLKYYLEDPIRILRVYDGGLAIHGGIVFGSIAAYLFCKKRKTSFLKTLDCLLPNVLIAQAIGRWGNFINQECHGPEVAESYFDGILTFIKEGMHINGSYYMPMFFYESVLCLVGFFFIRYFVKKKLCHKRGDAAWSYLMWYGLVRLYIESLRTDSLMIGNIKTAQLTSVLFIVLGVLGYIGVIDKLFKKEKPVIIFDFDGTLIDTDKSILGSFKEMYRRHDDVNNFTPEVQKYVLGPALKDAFKKLFPNENVQDMIHEYEEVQMGLLDLNEPIKNAELVLKTLKEEGYKIGICSVRIKEGIELRMKQFGLDQYIDAIYGLNEVVNLKPDPEAVFGIIKDNKWNKDDVIYIGDNVSDVECGYNYGAYSVGFISREEKREQLEKSHANVCIDDLIQVLDIVKEDHYFTYDLK